MKKILLSLLLVTSGLAYSFEPVLGRDYSLLENPLPTKQDGKVEVLEIFWYGCGHCYAMESKIKAWNKTTPEYVSFKKMPVTCCLLYTSPSPRDRSLSRMPSSA